VKKVATVVVFFFNIKFQPSGQRNGEQEDEGELQLCSSTTGRRRSSLRYNNVGKKKKKRRQQHRLLCSAPLQRSALLHCSIASALQRSALLHCTVA